MDKCCSSRFAYLHLLAALVVVMSLCGGVLMFHFAHMHHHTWLAAASVLLGCGVIGLIGLLISGAVLMGLERANQTALQNHQELLAAVKDLKQAK